MTQQRFISPAARWAVVASTAFALGCSSTDFESVSEISKTRLISLIATPPEVAPGETMEVDGTIARPSSATGPLYYEWTLCLFDEGPSGFYRCAEEIEGLPIDNILARSTDAQLVFEQDVLTDEELVTACDLLKNISQSAQVPPEFAASLPRCFVGLPVRLRLKVCEGAPSCADADAQIASTKVQLLFDEQAQRTDRNMNPTIQTLVLAGQLIPEDEPLEVQVEAPETELDISIGATVAEAAQRFTPVAEDNANPDEEREELQSDWYSTAGKLKGSRRFYREGSTTDEEFTENKITFVFDEVENGQIVNIWVTLRDSRGGNAAIQRQILLRK